MDALTAGIAIIAVQLCMALAIAGIYLVDRTRADGAQYWAIAELLLAAGIAVIVFAGIDAEKWQLILANNAIVWGAILQLWGIRTFHGEPVGRAGWIVSGLFFVIHLWMVMTDIPVPERIVLFSLTMLVLISLSFATVWRGMATTRGLGFWLVLGSLSLLIVNNLSRLLVLSFGAGEMGTATPAVPAVFVLYLIPLAGIVLYSVGLILLYFERSINEQRHLATHDELTGLLNRRALVAAGEREIGIALRYEHPLSVALVDIDFFKRINDRLGHQAGDAVLVDIARLLSQICRRGDLIGRYGGEEFCIVFPGVDANECSALGERLLDSIRRYRFMEQFPVTVSAGFATLGRGEVADSWQSLLGRADIELYKAKSQGRDGFFISPGQHAKSISGLKELAAVTVAHEAI